jgi:ABC-type multidrug transport system fused ATPase/permease subunit
MLKDAPILLLDEVTSALDSEVEAAIQQSLYRLIGKQDGGRHRASFVDHRRWTA